MVCLLHAGEKDEFEQELLNYKAQYKSKVAGLVCQSESLTSYLLLLLIVSLSPPTATIAPSLQASTGHIHSSTGVASLNGILYRGASGFAQMPTSHFQ